MSLRAAVLTALPMGLPSMLLIAFIGYTAWCQGW